MLSIHTRTHWNIFPREFAEEALGMQDLLGVHYEYCKIKKTNFMLFFKFLKIVSESLKMSMRGRRM